MIYGISRCNRNLLFGKNFFNVFGISLQLLYILLKNQNKYNYFYKAIVYSSFYPSAVKQEEITLVYS